MHALLDAKDELTSFNDKLEEYEQRRKNRTPSLELARSLATSSAGLDTAAAARNRLDTLLASRDLLADADPVAPIVKDLAGALRDAIHSYAGVLRETRKQAIEKLEAQTVWKGLEPTQRAALLADYHLVSESEPNLADPSAVLAAARVRPLQSWTAELDAIPQRASRALEAAVRLTTPAATTVAITVSTASLSSSEEVELYIDELRTQLLEALSSNDTVVVKG